MWSISYCQVHKGKKLCNVIQEISVGYTAKNKAFDMNRGAIFTSYKPAMLPQQRQQPYPLNEGMKISDTHKGLAHISRFVCNFVSKILLQNKYNLTFRFCLFLWKNFQFSYLRLVSIILNHENFTVHELQTS